tara:strand:+ start:2498 stop:2704 length:207 start_codon:yes stop_codon:yes gene_type:complete
MPNNLAANIITVHVPNPYQTLKPKVLFATKCPWELNRKSENKHKTSITINMTHNLIIVSFNFLFSVFF